jgi:putative thiamine transport system ATP-binding protein
MSESQHGAMRLTRVRIELAGRELVPALDVVVAPGECVTVMGPSGCGKSTLLAFISGALDAAFRATGSVCVGDEDITGFAPEYRRVGILFQDDLLFPHLSVGDNLSFAIAARVLDRVERGQRVSRALAEAELPGFEARDPASLSGGQRARVALMRTLLSAPRALLLDEPFSRLDAQLRGDFRRLVFRHAAERGLPTLLVTHDPADVPPGGRVIALGSLAP